MKVTLCNWSAPATLEAVEDKKLVGRGFEVVAQQAAGICVGKKDEFTEKGMTTAVSSGHYSILEHLPITWLVEDISRACSHQLVRHRMASYSQQSQRYCKVRTDKDDWYVIPKSINNCSLNISNDYHNIMEDIAILYDKLLAKGIPAEDARMVLPNACHTSILISMNGRSFIEACTLRMCNRAQLEIRAVFTEMREKIKNIYPTLYKLSTPNCTKKCGCLEAKPCGTPYAETCENTE